jgi:hypothetical protein
MQCLFRFTYPSAVHVSLIGAFNGWSTAATPMCRREDGTWEAMVELAPGLHRYCYFVIDGVGATGSSGDSRMTPWQPAGDVRDPSFLARLGVMNLGSELRVPSEDPLRVEGLNVLN